MSADTGVDVPELLRETDPARLDLEHERMQGRRRWAAMMLAIRVDVCRSILRGLPVRASLLDPVVLRRARRGRDHAEDEYLLIDDAMLDAIAEAGPPSTTSTEFDWRRVHR